MGHKPKRALKNLRPYFGWKHYLRHDRDPVIFNPILSTDTPSGFVNTRVYSGLLGSNENLEMIGDLAESWSFSEDGLVWTFKLKQGVKFHDGQPLTSADVKYTYEIYQAS